MSKAHPQQGDAEIYLGYVGRDTFDQSLWTTKRLGTPEEHPDNDAPDTFPMFIKKAEVVQRGETAYFDMDKGVSQRSFRQSRSAVAKPGTTHNAS